MRFFFLFLLIAPVESKPVSPAAGGIVAGAERVTGSGGLLKRSEFSGSKVRGFFGSISVG